MSQYVAPSANLTDRDVLLLIDQKLFTVIDQLYGNGRPGEIDLIHERITEVKVGLALAKTWQDERSGTSGFLGRWLPILIAAAAVAIALFRHS